MRFDTRLNTRKIEWNDNRKIELNDNRKIEWNDYDIVCNDLSLIEILLQN